MDVFLDKVKDRCKDARSLNRNKKGRAAINPMPVKHDIDTKAKLLITTWEGVALDVDFIEAIKNYRDTIQSKKEYRDFNEVVDFTQVTKIKLTTNGIKNISNIASNSDQQDVNSRLAFIVTSDLAYGLVRMYEAYRSFSKNAKKTIRVFKNRHDAFEWVQK